MLVKAHVNLVIWPTDTHVFRSGGVPFDTDELNCKKNVRISNVTLEILTFFRSGGEFVIG